ncbi:related to allantoate permease [Cephalotrichum gorgonifer]|uniref:Related to allantoate permease n=1 Tax=Cephalotrichum gorgonifer TaxID=2041049 RepID=A0AAE8N4H4_9PEZI|nr:related to allantoate permease [Cephalotrichum gorgonifer]
MRHSRDGSLPEEAVDAPVKPSIDAIEDVVIGDTIMLDKETNKRILRKIDRKLMPVLCITYTLQYYDKAVISQAAIFGLRTDLDLEEGLRYSWVMLIFFFGHIVGMYPCSLLAQRFRPRRVCSTLNILWAIIVLTTPACNSYSAILANRFFLGLIESGISPIFMLVVGLWYTHEEHSMRSSWWYSFSGGSLLLSPLINYGLAHIEGGPLKSWQWMFIVAGIITLAWGIALIWIFPDTPEEAKGWSPEDKRLLLERIKRDNSGSENRQLKLPQVWEALTDYQFWGLALIGLLSNTGAATLTTFSSIVFAGMGFELRHSLLLNMPFGVMAFLCVLGAGWLGSTRVGRLYTCCIASLPVILGCSLLWQVPSTNPAGRIVGLYLISFFASCWLSAISLGTSNVAGYSKKGAYAAGIWIGYCIGNIIGPLLFHSRYAPRYDESFIGVLICFAVQFVIALGLRVLLMRRNKNRDVKYGRPEFQHGLEDVTDKQNKSFRYTV